MQSKALAKFQTAQAWAETGRLSDEYYNLMSAWLNSRGKCGSYEDCRFLALEYDRTLDKFLAISEGFPHSVSGDKGIERAREYKSILAADLEYFEARAMK